MCIPSLTQLRLLHLLCCLRMLEQGGVGGDDIELVNVLIIHPIPAGMIYGFYMDYLYTDSSYKQHKYQSKPIKELTHLAQSSLINVSGNLRQ